MSLLKKILIPVIWGLVLLAGLCIFFALAAFEQNSKQEWSSFRKSMISEKTEKMRNLVELAHGILASSHENSDLDEEQRKINALSLIKTLRYNKSDYLWINDMQPTMIMHPINPALDGTSLAEFKDPRGKKVFVSMVDVCKRESEGTVDYEWPKPGYDKPLPKLSYVKPFKPWNWVIGTGLYIDDIDSAMAENAVAVKTAMKKQRNRLILIAALILGITAFVMTMITRSIVRPMTKAVTFAQSMSEGDLTQTLDVRQNDEIGALAKALNHMGANLNRMCKGIAEGVYTITSSATELSAISEQLSQSANQSANRSSSVAAASEQMSANMTSVVAASELASTNISMVASATEEMASTVKEIARNTAKANTIANEAVTQVRSTSDKVGQLGMAAHEISKVTEVINEISEQTNLLTLNATIEAARAG